MNKIIAPCLVLLTACVCSASQVRDVQAELKLAEAGWKLVKEDASLLAWNDVDGDAIVLQVLPNRSDFPNPSNAKALQARFREEAAKRGGGIVEVTTFESFGVTCGRVIMKFPQNGGPGNTYQTNVIVPTRESTIVLQVAAAEKQPTGSREAAVLIVTMEASRPPKTMEQATAGFYKDPYDPAFDKGAVYAISDDRKWDDNFPAHALTRARNKSESLVASWTIGDRLRALALYPGKAPFVPGRPAPFEVVQPGAPGFRLVMDMEYSVDEFSPKNGPPRDLKAYILIPRDEQSSAALMFGREGNFKTEESIAETYEGARVTKVSGLVAGQKVEWWHYRDSNHVYSSCSVTLRDRGGAQRMVHMDLAANSPERLAALEAAFSKLELR